jgi:hypothetical protein
VYDAETLEQKRNYTLPSDILEGWGMTQRQVPGPDNTMQTQLLISDGSNVIYGVDTDFNINQVINVKKNENKLTFRLIQVPEYRLLS